MMQKINPLYLVVILFVLLGVVLYEKYHLHSKLFQEQRSIQRLEEVAQKIDAFKRAWKDKRAQMRRIEAILNTFDRFVKERQKKRSLFKVRFEHVDASNADRIVSKIFNSFVKIKHFKIKRENQKMVSIDVEFVL